MIALAPSGAGASELVARSVPGSFRFAWLAAAPAVVIAAVVGPPLLHALLPGKVGADDVATLREFVLLLMPWLVAALVAALVFPSLFAAGRIAAVNRLLPFAIVLHIAVGLAARELLGVDGLVCAMAAGPAFLALAMIALAHAGAVLGPLTRDGARIAAAVAVTIGVPVGLAALAGGDVLLVAGAAVGAALYVLAIRRLMPAEWAGITGLISRRA